MFSDENVALVHKLARLIWLRYTYLDIEDLVQSGFVGLLRAGKKYDPRRGASFATYADKRILGEILDAVRRGRTGIRRLARIRREVREATRRIEIREQRPAANRELASEIEDYYLIEQELAGIDPTGLTDGIADQHDTEAEAHAERVAREIGERWSLLTPREEEVMRLYYIEGVRLREIGKRIGGRTESRASQILTGARKKLTESAKIRI